MALQSKHQALCLLLTDWIPMKFDAESFEALSGAQTQRLNQQDLSHEALKRVYLAEANR